MMNFIRNIKRTINGETSDKTLISRGMKIGRNFSRQSGCIIDNSFPWLIEIGNNVTFSAKVTILAHDASTKLHLGYAKIGKVKIGDNVFIGANSTVLCNVRIGDNVIVGANSVVTRNIPSGSVVAGNPARIICTIEEYLEKSKANITLQNVFDESYTIQKNISKDKKEHMKSILKDTIGYIK